MTTAFRCPELDYHATTIHHVDWYDYHRLVTTGL